MIRRLPAAIAQGSALVLTATLALPGASQGATSGCPTPAATVPTKAAIPPELRLLAQKMGHLRFTTIRASAQTILSSEEGKLILDVNSELRRSPRELFATSTSREVSSSGKSSSESEKVLEVGGMSYRYAPSVTHEDGGRPWVRERSHPSSKGISLEPSLSELADAESIVAAGTENLGGQQVARFAVTFPPGVYPERNLILGELFGAECPQPVVVELAIAPTGLPVEMNVSTVYYAKSGKSISSSSTTRILATNFHLSPLKRPPAKRTIGEAELRRLRASKEAKGLPTPFPGNHPKHKTL
jgi:hypothetical protein